MIAKSQLLRILADQREALLRRPVGIEREILPQMASFMTVPHVIVICGLRRCGKSTLMRQIIQKYYHDADFYYINFEDERLLNFNASDFNLVYEAQLELVGQKSVFFIDEIQVVPDFDRFIRRFYESGMKFFISGSNASLLRQDIGSRLTGRHVDIIIKPFSFREFLKAKHVDVPSPGTLVTFTTETRVFFKKLFDEYLLTGGMPERIVFGSEEILDHVYDDIVIKDVVVRHGITDVKSVRELYRYLISNFCRKFSYNRLANTIGIGSANTVKTYIQQLEDTYLAIIVPKFEFSVRKQIIADKKFYILDTGFIKRISPVLTHDKGWFMENHVISTLKSGDNVSYFSGIGECDVIVKENQSLSAIQVTQELGLQNKQREVDGLAEALSTLRTKTGLIITEDQEDEMRVGDMLVPVKPAWKWALEQG